MKYGLNTAPIAGPRRQDGNGTAALAVTSAATPVTGVSGAGSALLALSGAGAGINGTLGAGTAALAITMTDLSINPIGVTGAGELGLALAPRQRFLSDLEPREGFEPAPGRPFLTVPLGWAGFTVQPDSIAPVAAPAGFAVLAKGGR